MRTEDRQELIQAVDAINETLTEQLFTVPHGMDPWIWVEAQINSTGTVVMFLGECMYNSENEEREWIENYHAVNVGAYEPIEEWLRKSMRELLNKLKQIEL